MVERPRVGFEQVPNLECSPSNDVLTPEIIQLKNTTVNFYRVGHDLHTWEACKPQIHKMVESNDVIVLESVWKCDGFIGEDGEITEEGMQSAIEYFKKHGGNFDPNNIALVGQIRKVLKESAENSFFAKVEDYAAEMGKRIISLDPKYIATESDLETYDDNVDSGKKILGISGLAATLLLDLVTKTRGIKEKAQPSSISRRRFLQGTLGVAASLVPLLSHRLVYKGSKHTILDEMPNVFPHDMNDFRNVIIAEGLTQLDQRSEEGVSVGAIYGADHGPKVKDYVLSPTKRTAQLALYADYRKITHPHVRVFEHQNNAWSKIGGWEL